jgi:hypothetical protein
LNKAKRGYWGAISAAMGAPEFVVIKIEISLAQNCIDE